jgi:type IV secretory pathway VirB10-like protein
MPGDRPTAGAKPARRHVRLVDDGENPPHPPSRPHPTRATAANSGRTQTPGKRSLASPLASPSSARRTPAGGERKSTARRRADDPKGTGDESRRTARKRDARRSVASATPAPTGTHGVHLVASVVELPWTVRAFHRTDPSLYPIATRARRPPYSLARHPSRTAVRPARLLAHGRRRHAHKFATRIAGARLANVTISPPRNHAPSTSPC